MKLLSEKRKEFQVIKDQSMVLVRRMADFEIAVCGILNRISRPPKVGRFFVLISWLGDGRIWYALILTLPLVYGESGLLTSWSMVKVGIVNLALYKVIKLFAARARPCVVSADIILGTAPLDQYSFPSGHTMHAVAFSMIAAAQHPEIAWALVPLSCLIAMSRIVLGLHYPTDVLAGGMIGAYVAFTLQALRDLPWWESFLLAASASTALSVRREQLHTTQSGSSSRVSDSDNDPECIFLLLTDAAINQ